MRSAVRIARIIIPKLNVLFLFFLTLNSWRREAKEGFLSRYKKSSGLLKTALFIYQTDEAHESNKKLRVSKRIKHTGRLKEGYLFISKVLSKIEHVLFNAKKRFVVVFLSDSECVNMFLSHFGAFSIANQHIHSVFCLFFPDCLL